MKPKFPPLIFFSLSAVGGGKNQGLAVQKKNMRKADIPISMLFSILVSLFILVVVFMFIASLTGYPKTFYCKTVYKFTSKLWVPVSVRQNPDYCVEEKPFAIHKITNKQTILNKFFGNKQKKELIFVEAGEKTARIEVPENAKVISAEMEITAQALKEGPTKINVKIDFDEDGEIEKELELTPNKKERFEFSELLEQSIEDCEQELCTISIGISSEENARITLENLKIEYETCPAKEDLLYFMDQCWKEADHGEHKGDFFCYELVIPPDCIKKPISELDITDLLIKRNLCHILPNNDAGKCGDSNKIEFSNDITNNANVLIEYKNGKIEVS